MIHIVDD